MRHRGAAVLLQALGRYGSGECKDESVTREACGALRSATLGDDRRKDFSGIRWNLVSAVSCPACAAMSSRFAC